MVIDFHGHAYPAALAAKAIKNMRNSGGSLPAYTAGTLSGALAAADEAGIDALVLLAIATKPHQHVKINNWAAAAASDRIFPFGSVHPDAPNCFEELERIKSMGIKGVKFHPEYQNFFVDEPRMRRLYERIGEMGFITVFHVGYDIRYPEPVRCTPERLARVLPDFGEADVIAAHLGGYMMHKEAEKHLIGKRVYLDTAYSWTRMPLPVTKRLIDDHGADKVLFGSDMPWSSPAREKEYIEGLGLSKEDLYAVLGGNARKLLRI
ncbi:MAG: amidohydrolase family protein [Christensenellales bacterium]|jgi:predicted TIM-barrel fold metal-dependent hydrolase